MRRALWLALLAVAAWPTIGQAAQRCQVQAPLLAFGDYVPGSVSPVDSAAAIQVRCIGHPVTAFTVSIGPGSSGRAWERTMRSGVGVLVYNLFVDAARTIVWGDGTAGTLRVPVTPPPQRGARPREETLNVYGRIPAGQDPAPGAYVDTVIITVEF